MKQQKKIGVVLITLAILTTGLAADTQKGQSIYMKKMKAPCGIQGIDFAHKHTQDEWEELYESGNFKKVAQKICPKLKLKDKYVPHVYDFSYEYALDSGKIPSC